MEKRLLIVDKEGPLADAAREALGPDWQPTYVGDPEQALIIARIKVPGLVLCPVSLGGMDGYEFGRRLRGQPQTAEIPLILSGVYINRLELEEIPRSFEMTLPQPPDTFNNVLEKALKSADEAEVVEEFDDLFAAVIADGEGGEAEGGQPFELGEELLVVAEEEEEGAKEELLLGEEVTADLLEADLPETEEPGETIELSPAPPEDEESALALELLSEFRKEQEAGEEAEEEKDETLAVDFLAELEAEVEGEIVEVSEDELAEGLELLEAMELPADEGSVPLSLMEEPAELPAMPEAAEEADPLDFSDILSLESSAAKDAPPLQPFESVEAECEEECVAVELPEAQGTGEIELSCNEEVCPEEAAEAAPAEPPEFPPSDSELPPEPLGEEELEALHVLDELDALELSVSPATPEDEDIPAVLGITEDLPEATIEAALAGSAAGLMPEVEALSRDEALATNVDLLEELTITPVHEPEPILPGLRNGHAAEAAAIDYFATEAAREALREAVASSLTEEALKALIAEKVNEIVWKVVPPLAEKLLLEAIEKTRTMPEE